MAQPQPDRDRLLEHSYDGIQEYDNPMPRWWVYVFWATIVFSVLYALNIPGTGIGSGAGRIAQYDASVAEFEARQPQQGPGASETQLAGLVNDANAIALGKTTFAARCAACHGPAGGGIIGPNLTDEYWIHGGSLAEIHHTVSEGVTAKGMPGWSKLLKPEELNAVVAYIATLEGTNPPGAKAPEGDVVPAAAN